MAEAVAWDYASRHRKDSMVPNIYYSDLHKHEPLSRAEEGKLTARLKRRPSKTDHDRLITSNLRYVVKVARSYRDRGLPIEDLINEGNLGLIEAVSRYDPSRENRFLTYADWWIRKAILGALSKQTLIRIPANQQTQIRRARQEEAHRIGERGGPEKASAEPQGVAEKWDALLRARPIELSLEDAWGTNADRPVDDLMPSQNAIDPEAEMIRRETKDTVHRAMASLTGVQCTIIRERFGMDDKAPRTLQEIGTDLGLSRERIRQIEIESKDKIRRAVTERAGRTRARRSVSSSRREVACVGASALGVPSLTAGEDLRPAAGRARRALNAVAPRPIGALGAIRAQGHDKVVAVARRRR
jgi:RNA polymerase nonessential primary-like sigma factor